MTQKLIEEADPEKLTAAIATLDQQITDLDKDIKKYESVEWKNTSQVLTDHLKKQRGEARTQREAYDNKLNDSVPIVKSLIGDQSRINSIHNGRMSKLKEQHDRAKQRREEAETKQKEKLQAEKERHLKEMARLEELFDSTKQRVDAEILELKRKIDEEEEDYQRKKKELKEALADTNIVPEKASAAAEVMQKAKPDSSIIAHLRKAQEEIDVSEQLQESQIVTMATTVSSLLDSLKQEMRQQLAAEFAARASEQAQQIGVGTTAPTTRFTKRKAEETEPNLMELENQANEQNDDKNK